MSLIMGMSLERVQFKFASIIGELCSQPDVLSQFAVWLDLRLAEYKLKGAISLDCSGEEPDPVWLQGLNKHKPAAVKRPTDNRTQRHSHSPARASASHHRPSPQISVSDIPISHSHTVPSMDLAERLSPDVVVVKEEPGDVYPVSIHLHESRKRPASETVSSDLYTGQGTHNISSSPSHMSKQRRVSTTDSPSNQSLMSVIGGYQSEVEESDSFKAENSDSLNFPSTSAADNRLSTSDTCMTGDVSVDSASGLNNTAVDWMDQSGINPETTDNSEVPPPSSIRSTDLSLNLTNQIPFTLESHLHVEKSKNLEISRKSERSNRMRHFAVPETRLGSITKAVGLFERWLWNVRKSEQRGMHEIPPRELDPLLAEFFADLKLANGANYSLSYFKSLRSNLDFYLKCTDYPASITYSDMFRKSQAAYKSKASEIKLENVQNLPHSLTDAFNSSPCSPVTSVRSDLHVTESMGSHY